MATYKVVKRKKVMTGDGEGGPPGPPVPKPPPVPDGEPGPKPPVGGTAQSDVNAAFAAHKAGQPGPTLKEEKALLKGSGLENATIKEMLSTARSSYNPTPTPTPPPPPDGETFGAVDSGPRNFNPGHQPNPQVAGGKGRVTYKRRPGLQNYKPF